jgi:uncharacterized protein YbjT (DUF2867 family)
MNSYLDVLVVGGTGFLGRQVVAALQASGKPVRALVRPGSDASRLEASGVVVVRGDMLKPETLDGAFRGVDAVITSAVGYTKRRTSDTPETDTLGNRNLVDAAQRAGLRRFVFTGILRSDLAEGVPHFWNKTLTERYLAEQKVPYVSLRPGAFFDQIMDLFPGGGPRRGRVISFGRPDVPQSWVLSGDVADALAALVDAPGVDGEHMDLGWDRPVSTREVALLTSSALGHRVRTIAIPPAVLSAGLGLAARFSEQAADLRAMSRFFGTGQFVADTRRQYEVFGAVPAAEDAIRRWASSEPHTR